MGVVAPVWKKIAIFIRAPDPANFPLRGEEPELALAVEQQFGPMGYGNT